MTAACVLQVQYQKRYAKKAILQVRNLIAEIRVISLISANFVCISFAQYCIRRPPRKVTALQVVTTSFLGPRPRLFLPPIPTSLRECKHSLTRASFPHPPYPAAPGELARRLINILQHTCFRYTPALVGLKLNGFSVTRDGSQIISVMHDRAQINRVFYLLVLSPCNAWFQCKTIESIFSLEGFNNRLMFRFLYVPQSLFHG